MVAVSAPVSVATEIHLIWAAIGGLVLLGLGAAVLIGAGVRRSRERAPAPHGSERNNLA